MEQYSKFPSDPPYMSKLLKVDEVAEQLNISKSFAYSLMKTGQLPSVRLGRSVRVHPRDLKEYIERNTARGFGFI